MSFFRYLFKRIFKRKKISKNAVVEYLEQVSAYPQAEELLTSPTENLEYLKGYAEGRREMAKSLLAVFELKVVIKQILAKKQGYCWEDYAKPEGELE